MRTSKAALAAAALIILIASGCSRGGSKTPQTNPGAESIQSDVLQKISRMLLSDIPIEGRLKEIRDRGIIRVALPPEEPPFQSLDPEFKVPYGFNPELANEIATLLEVKANITVLKNAADIAAATGVESDFDLVFMPENADCPDNRRLPYLFSGPDNGWKNICVGDRLDSLAPAVSEILTYLNETGIFARLYISYVEK